MQAKLLSATIKDARIQAFSNPLVAPPPHGFVGGLVVKQEDNGSLKALRQSRYWQPVDSARNELTYENSIAGEWAYGGPIYNHFGHFMSEMAHRVLPSLLTFGAHKTLFVGLRNEVSMSDYNRFPAFFREYLHFFKLEPVNIAVINTASTVETLHVSEAGSDFGGGPKAGYLQDLKEFTQRRLRELTLEPRIGGKIYVSRRNLPVGGSFLGETYLEDALVDEGFQPFFPENHTLVEQMNVYAHAEIIIFPEGSACHGTELMGEKMLRRCFLLTRRKDHVEVFAKVLRPRSKEFAVFESSTSLGSIVGEKGGIPANHIGVSLYNVNKLVNFFRQNNVAKLNNFTVDGYLRAAENDLSRYILRNLKRDRITSIEDMGALYRSFSEACSVMNEQ